MTPKTTPAAKATACNTGRRAVQKFATRIAEFTTFGPNSAIEALVSTLGGRIENQGFNAPILEIDIADLHDFVIHDYALYTEEQRRYAIAKALAHYLLHYPKPTSEKDDPRMRVALDESHSHHPCEQATWEAHWFASELLMPEQIFRKAALRHGTKMLSAYFGVPMSVASRRGRELGIVEKQQSFLSEAA